MTVQTKLPVPVSSNRLTTFSPRRKAVFLTQLAETGNVRLGCRAANISPQTAYRARRQSPAFAQAWDAALLAARPIAEATLADRALNGVEVPVFYHGEEVATRTRYDTRLLLAHLGRLDRIESGAAMAGAVHALDTQIATLEGGAELGELASGTERPTSPLSGGCEENTALRQAQGERFSGAQEACQPNRVEASSLDHNPVPGVPSVQFDPAEDEYADDELPELERRLRAMEAARPREARKPHHMAHTFEEAGDIEALQLEAFEAGEDNWWEVMPSRCGLEEGQKGQPIGQIENQEDRSSESLCLDPQRPGEEGSADADRSSERSLASATRALHPSTRSLPGDQPGGRVEGAGGAGPKKTVDLAAADAADADDAETTEVEVEHAAEDRAPDPEASHTDPTPPELPVGWRPVEVSAKPKPPHAGWIPQAQWRAEQKASQQASQEAGD